MTIKRRLAISNVLMILVPVGITVLIALGCIGMIWYTVAHSTGLGFEDSEDFFHASQGISEMVVEALKTKPEERTEKLTSLSSLLDQSAMSLTVLQNDRPFYTYGDSSREDIVLLKAVSVMGKEGTATKGERCLYAHHETVGDHTYQIYLFCSQSKLSYQTLKIVVVLAAITLGFTIFLSIFLTDRFLIHFVFRKVEKPLDILASGVREIGDGNLDYRIEYPGKDEFTPICEDFNEMAIRLKQSVEQTQRHEESRKELLAGISHDLRSPLTSIQAYVEGLLDGVAHTPEMQKKYLLTIKSKAEDIQRMVSQIFLFSKMDMDEYPVNLKPIRLDEEITALVRSTGAEYADQGLEISTELMPITVTADPDQLRRILTNIIDNSLKYRHAETGHLQIRLEDQEHSCLMTLTDDGPGAPKEALGKLFDAFYRSDPSRQNPNKGSGLGLAIAAKAIRRMGGSIWAENAPSGGLSILIALPKGGTTECPEF